MRSSRVINYGQRSCACGKSDSDSPRSFALYHKLQEMDQRHRSELEGDSLDSGNLSFCCSLCLGDYQTPKVLPCCHTFCQACLEDALTRSGSNGEELTCPECKEKHALPPSGVPGLLDDCTVARAAKKRALSCGMCDSDSPVDAVAYCVTCSAYICAFCESVHNRVQHYKSHKLLPLNSEDLESLCHTTTTLYCPTHDGSKLDAYCITCHCLVCVACVVEKHQTNHQLRLVEENTREEVEGVLYELVSQTREKFEQFEEHLRYIQHVETVVNNHPEKYISAINTAFDAQIAVLESRRAELLKKAEGIQEKAQKDVWVQKEYVERAVTNMQGILNFSKRLTACRSNADLLALASKAIARLNELETVQWESDEMEDLEQSYFQFTSKDIRPNLESFGQLKFTNAPCKLVVEGEPANPTLGEKCVLKVSVVTESCNEVIQSPGLKVSATVAAGKSRKQICLGKPKRCPDGSWNAECVLVCGGKNIITINAVRPKGFNVQTTCTVNVSGIPPVGARVVKGPDWQYIEPEAVGIVQKHHVPALLLTAKGMQQGYYYSLQTLWGNRIISFRWGDDGFYDVQLATEVQT